MSELKNLLLSDNKEDHIEGDCCCQCVNQKLIKSHPWVDGNPCTNTFGYICAVSLHPSMTNNNFDENNFVTLSNKHGRCECFDRKKTPLEKLYNI